MRMQEDEQREVGGGRRLSRREVLAMGGASVGALGLVGLLGACGGGGGGPSATTEAAPSGETGATSASGGATGGGKEIESMSWAISGDPVSMDYAFSYDFSSNVPVENITEPLLRINPDGQLEPNLAESWEEVDATTFVYRLRSGVRFHDETEMTAEDVAFSLARHMDPDVGSYYATFYERVDSVDATGPLEVTVKLSQPDAIWQYAAATNAAAVSSRAFIEQHGKDYGSPQVGSIGTGPCRFVSWTAGREVVLERFDDYWNTERANKVKQFIVRNVEDEATIVQALGTGELDGVFGSALSGKSSQALSRFDNVEVFTGPSYLVHYLILNTQKPPFDDARVRQALAYAIDKPGMLASTWGGQGEAGIRSPAVPAMWTFATDTFSAAYDQLPTFDRDLDKAKSLIDEAGAAGASARMLVALPFDEEQAVAIQDAGKQIGLDLSPEKLPYADKIAQEFAGTEDREYTLSVSQWGSDVPDPAGNLQLPFYSKNLVTNNSAYKNPQVDELLEKQRAATDPEERARILTEAQELIVADQPWIVFYTPFTLMALNSRVGGYSLRPLWYWDPFVADFSGV